MTEHNHKAYTAADFERYYSGQMSNEEMHALEKSALEDTFLADALEGYSYTKTPVDDVTDLRERFSKKNKKKQLFFLQNKVWLKVAASIILFAGLSYMVYELNSKKSFLATTDTKQFIKANDSLFTAENDTIKRNETASLEKVSKLNNGQTLRDKNYKEQALKKLKPDSSGLTAYNFSKSENKNAISENETHLLEGKLVDTAGKALVIAGIKVSDKETVITDSLSNLKLNTGDTLQTADIAATSYKTKQRKVANNADRAALMNDANQNLEEVVVTGYGVSKKKKDSTLLTGKVTGISFNDPNYGPIGGWEKFDQYLTDNISISANDNKERFSAKVVVSFEVDENGDPKKVKIEQSQCKECDKEALRLLQSGPKWKYVSGKKYVIDVKF